MKNIFLILCLVGGERLSAQENGDSYISHPTKNKVLFEGQIAPEYQVYQIGKDPDKYRKGFTLQIIATPKILLKLYESKERPVKTPSYMPEVSVQATWKTRSVYFYPFITFAHHSNGQSGNPLVQGEAGDTAQSVNTTDGNFLTNYIKVGYGISLARFKNHRIGVSYEHHPVHGWWFQIDEPIKRMYGRKRLHFDYSYASKNIEVDAHYTKIYDEWELSDDVASRILELTAKFKIPGFKGMAWIFANAYTGQDYYNIYFTKEIRQLKMGLSIKTKLIGF